MIGTANYLRDLEVSPHGHRRLSTVRPRDRPRQAHPRPARRRRLPRLRRRLDRQRRAPFHQERPSLLGTGPAMGSERIPAHLRRLHAAGRPRRRPARPPPCAGSRHRGDRPRLARRRPGPELRAAGRCPSRTGPRRCGDAARRTVDPHHDLQGGLGPHDGTRGLGRHGWARFRRGRAPRRPAHRGPRLALGDVRQPAGRAARARRDLPADQRREA